MAVWTFDEIKAWVDENGGGDVGLNALERATAEGRFSPTRAQVARQYLKVERDLAAKRYQSAEESVRMIRDGMERIDGRVHRDEQAQREERAVRAAESQAVTAKFALVVAVFALVVSFMALWVAWKGLPGSAAGVPSVGTAPLLSPSSPSRWSAPRSSAAASRVTVAGSAPR